MRHTLFAILMAVSTLAMAESTTMPSAEDQPRKVIALFDELIKNYGIDSLETRVIKSDPVSSILRLDYLSIPFTIIERESDNTSEIVKRIRQTFEDDRLNCYLLHHIAPNSNEHLQLDAYDGCVVIRSKDENSEVWLLCVRHEIVPDLRDAYAISFCTNVCRVDGWIYKLTSPIPNNLAEDITAIEGDLTYDVDTVATDTIPAEYIADDMADIDAGSIADVDEPLSSKRLGKSHSSKRTERIEKEIENQLRLINIWDDKIRQLKDHTNNYDIDYEDVKKRIKALHKQAMKAQEKVEELVNDYGNYE